MHPLLLFTLFFIPGLLPLSRSSSVKKMLEEPNVDSIRQSKSVFPFGRFNIKGGDDQRNPNVRVTSDNKGQSIVIPFNDGPSSHGSVQYFTSFDDTTGKSNPDGVYVQTFAVQSVDKPHSYEKINPDTKEKTTYDTYKKILFIKTSFGLPSKETNLPANYQVQTKTYNATVENQTNNTRISNNEEFTQLSIPSNEVETSFDLDKSKQEHKNFYEKYDEQHIFRPKNDYENEVTDNYDVDETKNLEEDAGILFPNIAKIKVTDLNSKQNENNINLSENPLEKESVKSLSFKTIVKDNLNPSTEKLHNEDNDLMKVNQNDVNGVQSLFFPISKNNGIENKPLNLYNVQHDILKDNLHSDNTPTSDDLPSDNSEDGRFATTIESPLLLNTEKEELNTEKEELNTDSNNVLTYNNDGNNNFDYYFHNENTDDLNHDENNYKETSKTDEEGNSISDNSRNSDKSLSGDESATLSTTSTTEMTPLQAPPHLSSDHNARTESDTIHHETDKKASKDENEDHYDKPYWYELSKDLYSGFITQLIHPLFNGFKKLLY